MDFGAAEVKKLSSSIGKAVFDDVGNTDTTDGVVAPTLGSTAVRVMSSKGFDGNCIAGALCTGKTATNGFEGSIADFVT